ncbi:MAG: LytTR family DNA-binding domain-containing protein [Bacteroidia bacterium]
MKVLILEDEYLAAERLQRLIQRYDPQIEVIQSIGSVEEALAHFRAGSAAEVVFADIHLADGLCFEIFQATEVNIPVIFTTSYDQYALEAFAVHSIDYLLKPIRYEKLAQSLDKLAAMRKALGEPAPAAVPAIDYDALASSLRQQEGAYKTRFMVRIGVQIRSVKVEEIAYFHADQKVTLLVTREGRRFPLDHSLDRLTEMVDPKIFFRVNRRFLVHLDAVRVIHPYFKGRLKLELDPAIDDDVVISSDKTPAFKDWLDQ